MSAHTPTSEVLGSGLMALQEESGSASGAVAAVGFTPGPWVADLDGIGWQPGNGQEDHNEVCCLGHTTYDAVNVYAPHKYPPSSSYAEFAGNARLIAAAPELLAALIAAEVRMVFANKHIDCDRELEQMRAAIQKATVSHS